jgi:AhpC/TSA family
MFRSAIAVLASLLISSAALAAPEIGKPAPDFKAMDAITGKSVALAELKGKTVVLEWNNFHCPFIKKFYSVGAMQEFQTSAIKDGVVWMSINSGAKGKEGFLKNAKEAKKEIAANKSNASHYLLDPSGVIGHAYEAKSTPHMYVIDKEGTLVYMGAIDDKPSADSADIASATNYVSQALKALSKGKKVKTAMTKSYGCFVKY